MVQSPKHWTGRGFPVFYLFYLILTTTRSCIHILMMKALKWGEVNLPKAMLLGSDWAGIWIQICLMSFKGAKAQGAGKDRWGRPKRSKKVPLSPHTQRPSRASPVLGLGMAGWEEKTQFPSVCSSWLGGEARNEPGRSEGICYGQKLDFIKKPWVQIRVLPFPSCSSSHSISLNLIFFHYKTEIKNISYLIGQLGR